MKLGYSLLSKLNETFFMIAANYGTGCSTNSEIVLYLKSILHLLKGKKKMEQALEKEYFDYLKKIKETINENRSKAMVVVNSAMIITYYKIGCIINERKRWGTKFIKKLANDLQEYGTGYSYDQLKRMSQFATTFTQNEITEQPVPQIPWGTIIIIMKRSSSKEEILWYINQTYKNKWSRSTVLKQFELQAYQRGIIEPLKTNDSIDSDIIKDTLSFAFISNDEVKTEKDLKDKMIDNVLLFLEELGPGFALIGREYRISTPSNKNFYIDLLMYHVKAHCYVVIEVKIDEILPSDFGQLIFYVNAIDDLEKTDIDNPTIGILLCKNADKYVVETTFKGIKSSIGVSKYKLLEDLPNYLIKRLNEGK